MSAMTQRAGQGCTRSSAWTFQEAFMNHSPAFGPIACWLLTAFSGIAEPSLAHGLIRFAFSSGTLHLRWSLILGGATHCQVRLTHCPWRSPDFWQLPIPLQDGICHQPHYRWYSTREINQRTTAACLDTCHQEGNSWSSPHSLTDPPATLRASP